MEIGKPPFVAVQDIEMGFEKIVKIAHSRGGSNHFKFWLNTFLNHLQQLYQITACKQQDIISKLRTEVSVDYILLELVLTIQYLVLMYFYMSFNHASPFWGSC